MSSEAMAESVIIADRLGKSYRIWEDPSQRLISPLLEHAGQWLPGPPGRALREKAARGYRNFFALDDINFEIKRGESVGIVGRNGAGKSTLLQLIAGTLQPSAGRIEVNGRVAALLELGAGFNPDFTGRENVFLNGAILGLSASEMERRFDDIAAFADIGEFLDQPVKTYSSGMGLRLAFAVQTAVEPEILIVDEALAVGDMFFQAKCMARLRKMLANGLTLLLVSHEPSTVKSLCSRALLLDRSKLLCDGTSEEVAEKYFALKVGAAESLVQNPTTALPPGPQGAWAEFTADTRKFAQLAAYQRSGNGAARFAKVALCDAAGREIDQVAFGQRCRLRLALTIRQAASHLTWGVHLRDEHQRDILYADATRFSPELTGLVAGEHLLIELAFTLHLKEGRYSIHVGCAAPIDLQVGQVEYCDLIPIACQFYAERPTPCPIYAPVLLQAEAIVSRYQ